MPYSRDPKTYPDEFQELFRRATEEPVEVVCDSANIATNLHHRLHAYRRAAEEARIAGWTELRNVIIQRSKGSVILKPSRLMTSIHQALQRAEPTQEELDKYWDEAEKSDGKEKEAKGQGKD